ncbi:MAG: DUF2604 domain-containing protein [Gammaproteobacteria bacterium]|nr:DUF2604 domain-containing protein [Gammaproteobacteria bacterium]
MKTDGLSLNVVVNGQPVTVEVDIEMLMQTVVLDALKKTGNSGQAEENWELRDSDGRIIDLNKAFGALDLKPDATLFLNLRAGIGGSE